MRQPALRVRPHPVSRLWGGAASYVLLPHPGLLSFVPRQADRGMGRNLHFLVTEGGADEAGVFHLVPRIDDSRLEEIFAREVLAFLVRRELLSPEWAECLLSWRHTGFSVHSQVSRLTICLPKSFAETGHFQGGVKLPPRRFADPLRGATPPPSNSPGGCASFLILIMLRNA